MSKVNTRNASIDLLRLFLMYAICIQHVTCVGGYVCPWLNKISSFGVNGFILISAWYGISFRVSKVLKLLMCGVYCAVIIALAQCLHAGEWLSFGSNMVDAINGWWFLHAYIALVMLSPMLNMAASCSAQSGQLVRTVLLMAFVVFGWSYATTLPTYISRYVPNAICLGSRLITVCGAYFIGRSIRICYDRGVRWHIGGWYLSLALVVFLVLKIIGMDDLNSPANLCVSGLVFYVFYNMKPPSKLGRFAALCAASVFSVYLFHVSCFAFSLYEPMKDIMVSDWGLNRYVIYVIASLGFVLGGLLLDVPRRIVGKIIDPVTRPALKLLDDKVERLFQALESRIAHA